MTGEAETSPQKSTAPAANSGAQDLTGRRLGEFQLLRRLGRGGMAEVYLAEQTSLNRQVAVKVLREEFVADEQYLKRFRREATAAGSLNHPNIVQVYVIGEQDGVYYIAQEYVQGQNLREFISRKGPPDLPTALRIIKQVCSALQAAGDAGIVHRDIKPENILLTRGGEVKVADFGLAQLMQGGEGVALTQVGITMGTPLYMSPEQVNGKPLDQRSDLYSLGVTCYHMLSGRPPFQGETALAIAVQHLNEIPEPLAARRPDLPKDLCHIVHRMMAKDLDERYPDAQSVLDDLGRLGQPGAVRAVRAGRKRKVKPRAAKRPLLDRPIKQQLVGLIPACLVAAALAAAAGWMLRPGNPLETPVPAEAGVRQQDNPMAQYYLAQSMNTEDAWQAVIKHWPGRVEEQRAQENLGLLYLRERRYEDAEEIFSRLVLLGHDEPQLKAVGLAGQVALACWQNDETRIEVLMNQLRPLLPHLDAQMRDAVREAMWRHGGKLWDKYRNDLRTRPEAGPSRG